MDAHSGLLVFQITQPSCKCGTLNNLE